MSRVALVLPGRVTAHRAGDLRRAARPRPRRPAPARAAARRSASQPTSAVWDDPAVDWAAYDLVVLRSPWDYAPRRDEFVAWARVGAAAGQPGRRRRVEHRQALPGRAGRRRRAGGADRPGSSRATTGPPPAAGEWVIKPAVSAGSQDTGRYDLADPAHREQAVAHVRRLQDAGRVVMVQPYLPAVDTVRRDRAALPRTATFSHAIRKGPMLDGPDLGVDGPLQGGGDHRRASRRAAELAVAERVLAAVPAARAAALRPGRPDPGPDGEPCWSSWSSPSRRCSSATPTGARRAVRRGRIAGRGADRADRLRPRILAASQIGGIGAIRGRRRLGVGTIAVGRRRRGRGDGRRSRVDQSVSAASQTRQAPSMCATDQRRPAGG